MKKKTITPEEAAEILHKAVQDRADKTRRANLRYAERNGLLTVDQWISQLEQDQQGKDK